VELGGECEFPIRKCRHALAILDTNIKKLVALLHAVGKTMSLGFRNRFKCIAFIEHYW